MPFAIGTRLFASKARAEAFVRDLLLSFRNTRCTDPSSIAFLFDLVKLHPRYVYHFGPRSKAEERIAAFHCARNQRGAGCTLLVEPLASGPVDDSPDPSRFVHIGWPLCVRYAQKNNSIESKKLPTKLVKHTKRKAKPPAKPTKAVVSDREKRLIAAARFAVDPQIATYRQYRVELQEEAHGFGNIMAKLFECAHCKKEKLHISAMQVDHKTQFKQLLADFVATLYEKRWPDYVDATTVYSTAADGSRRVVAMQFNDQRIAERWSDYHKQRAILRLVCRDCNLSALKKKDCVDNVIPVTWRPPPRHDDSGAEGSENPSPPSDPLQH